MMQLFWFSAAVVIYVYFGYPLFLKLRFLGGSKPWHRGHAQPLISVIVAAHNEESVIESKIKNLLSSGYPRERVEVLIGSDGSSDSTEDIVRQFVADGVGLISFPQHQGKSAIQNGLVAKASGAILVFTDADCIVPVYALSCLVENFADERIGLVTGIPRYQNDPCLLYTSPEGRTDTCHRSASNPLLHVRAGSSASNLARRSSRQGRRDIRL